jgi:O-antigen ligase
MDFKLGAVFATTGGFGSNQVSTILGLAMFIVFMLEIYKKPLFDISMINYGLMGYLFFRGLLTFSRGGVISAVIAMFILYIPIMFKSKRSIINSVIAGVLLGIGGAVVFLIADSVTKNNLTLRYKGETSGTLAGTKEQSLSNITSRRWEIAVTDWEIFKAHPIFGVGPGEARNYREEYGGINIVAHVEYSRLLSEHGIFGGAAMIIITLFAVSWVVRLKSKKGKVISAAFFTLAILSSFHAATRTNTTSVFYVLAAMPIYYDLKRPQVKAIKAAEDAENV